MRAPCGPEAYYKLVGRQPAFADRWTNAPHLRRRGAFSVRSARTVAGSFSTSARPTAAKP